VARMPSAAELWGPNNTVGAMVVLQLHDRKHLLW